MKLVHMKMKQPEDDVSLSNGELFMVRWAPYVEHLAHAPPRQLVSSHRHTVNVYELTCAKKLKWSNHRAQNNSNIHWKHLDSTGKGACACARRGAFIPHCVVDFRKGEPYI
jgi:hypothetical protein